MNRVLPARGHAGDQYRLDEALDFRSVAPAVLSPSNVPLPAQADEGVIDARDDLRRAMLAFDKARMNKNRGVRIPTRRWQPL
ncbi:MAG TPA: hypothetical protein VGC79_00300, partial [Polyangiaceae bacterium]